MPSQKIWFSILLVSIIIAASNSHPGLSQPLPSQTITQAQATPTPSASVVFSPPNVTDLSLTAGKTVSYSVEEINSTTINLWYVSIAYNYSVLHTIAIDYSNSVLGSGAQIQYKCIDDVAGKDGTCQPQDAQGVVTLSLGLVGGAAATPPPVGVLFNITFNIVATGFTQLHLFDIVLTNAGAVVPTSLKDGYFTNMDCPSNSLNPCRPPVVDFTVTPSKPSLGRPATFNATTSRATNPNAFIRDYFWVWGDNQIPLHTGNVTTHTYNSVFNFPVTLRVTDSYGVSWKRTLIVQVLHLFIDLTIGDMTIDPRYHLYPGTVVKITAAVVNNSTLPEDGNLTIELEGHVIPGQPSKLFHLGPFRQTTSLTVTWDSSGLTPRIYRVDAVVLPLKDENITTNNIKSAFVQLVDPLLTGSLSLNLAATTGLGLVLVAAIIFAVTRFRRKPSFLDEPL